MNKGKKKEIAIKGSPGIYKTLYWSEKKEAWVSPKHSREFRALPYRATKRIRIDGKSKKFQKKFSSIEEARLWLSKLTTDSVIKNTPADSLTFAQLVQDWRNHVCPPRIAVSTYQSYEKDIKHLSFFNHLKVIDIKPQNISDWITHVQAPEYPKSDQRVSFRRELKVLQTILNWYKEKKNYKFYNPILATHRKDITFKTAMKKGIQRLTAEESERVLTELKKQTNPVYYYLAATQLFCGLRIGEACALDWDSLILGEKEVKLVINKTCFWDSNTKKPKLVKNTKNSTSRTLILPQRLVTLLQKWKKQSIGKGLIFHRYGDLLRYNAIQRANKKAFKAARVSDYSTHVFRHTFATILTEQSKDLRATQAYLGHHDLKVTQRYAEVTENVSRNAIKDFAFGQNTPD